MAKRRPEEDTDLSESVVLIGSSPCSKRPIRRANSRGSGSRQQGKLDSNLFQCYFRNIWRSFPEDKRVSFTYFECMWFSLYMDEFYRKKVLTWMKRKAMFSKKYVLVPIVHWNHWCLLILCNFGESLQSKTNTPCMLMLDSLQEAGQRRFEPAIRKFVSDIYEAEGRPESRAEISQIPFLVPKVPQQRNGVECGNFVLYFMRLFVGHAPENFRIDAGYPYFMKEDWFGPEDYQYFCKELNSYGTSDSEAVEVD